MINFRFDSDILPTSPILQGGQNSKIWPNIGPWVAPAVSKQSDMYKNHTGSANESSISSLNLTYFSPPTLRIKR